MGRGKADKNVPERSDRQTFPGVRSAPGFRVLEIPGFVIRYTLLNSLGREAEVAH